MTKEKPLTSAPQQKTPQPDSIDQPQDVHKIEATLFSTYLPKVRELQSVALESTNYHYKSAEHRVTAIIIDTAQNEKLSAK